MFFEDTLFLVPIYRQTKEQYFAELKSDFKKYENNIAKEIKEEDYLKQFFEKNEREKRYARWVEREGISFWEVNQIIGWIQFYLHVNNIKANLWFIKSKRINKRPKRKQIEFLGKLGDVSDIIYYDNFKIRTDILQFIKDVKKGLYGYKFLIKYHINIEWLLKIIDHIDIKSIVESNIEQ